MEIVHGRADGPSAAPQQNFTGQVYNDRILTVPDAPRVGNVFFAPGARTHWHSHEEGQILQVVSGKGRVAREGGEVEVVEPGDVVWAPPGENHWHGADPESYLVHTAFSFGDTQWDRAVSEEEYGS